jgi:IMP dehydrogenase/GMP reductase
MQDLLISRMGKLTQKTVELTPENIELVASRETVAAAGNALKTSIQPAVPASPFAGIAG